MGWAAASTEIAMSFALAAVVWGIAWGVRGWAESAANKALCRMTGEAADVEYEDEDAEAAE